MGRVLLGAPDTDLDALRGSKAAKSRHMPTINKMSRGIMQKVRRNGYPQDQN
jgi:hypothetical protein